MAKGSGALWFGHLRRPGTRRLTEPSPFQKRRAETRRRIEDHAEQKRLKRELGE